MPSIVQPHALVRRFQASKEIHSIEMLRGIASAMVCFFHLSWGNTHFLPDHSFTKVLGTWGWAGVEIFFVISGFIIPYSMYVKQYTMNDFGIFLKKRIIRIEPPYLISIVAVIVLNYVSTLSPYYRGAPFSIDWPNVAGHVAYLNVFTNGTWLNPVYWSLAVEFQYYLLIALCFSLIVSEDRKLRLLFFILFAASSYIPGLSNNFLFPHAAYFLAGISLFQFLSGKIGVEEFGVLMAAELVLIYMRMGVVMTSIIVCTVVIIAYVNKVPSVLRKLGLISYSLYLVHVPVGGRIINICDTLVKNVLMRQIVVYIVFAVCVGVGYLFYITVERAFKRYSSAIKYDHKPAGVLS